jgi:hypothetical protein
LKALVVCGLVLSHFNQQWLPSKLTQEQFVSAEQAALQSLNDVLLMGIEGLSNPGMSEFANDLNVPSVSFILVVDWLGVACFFQQFDPSKLIQ